MSGNSQQRRRQRRYILGHLHPVVEKHVRMSPSQPFGAMPVDQGKNDEGHTRTELIINPIQQTVEIRNCDFMADQTMNLTAFKQLCFDNNWEGTLYKVRATEEAIEEAIMDALYAAERNHETPTISPS